MRKFLLISAAAVSIYGAYLCAAQHLQGFAKWHEVPDPVA